MGIAFIAYDIMKYDLEKLTTYTHWVIWHKLQTVQSELILLFSFQWLLILSSVNIDHKSCLFQKRFYINPEEQIKHSQRRLVLFHFESSWMSVFFDHHMKSCPWEEKNHWLICAYIGSTLHIFGPIVLLICPIKSLFLPEVWLPKFIVISFFLSPVAWLPKVGRRQPVYSSLHCFASF